MTSNILNTLGFGNIDIGIILIAIIIILVIFLICICSLTIQLNRFKKKYQKFMQGKNGSSLEKDIMALYQDNVDIKKDVEENKNDIDRLFKKHEFAYQKLGLVKYDAFKEMGGKLSFSLALLNERNDGFIINSVHSSDGCYSYTKRILKGECSITLSNEEREAVDKAINRNI